MEQERPRLREGQGGVMIKPFGRHIFPRGMPG